MTTTTTACTGEHSLSVPNRARLDWAWLDWAWLDWAWLDWAWLDWGGVLVATTM